jgi:transforming growth factor-beta-induced protein
MKTITNSICVPRILALFSITAVCLISGTTQAGDESESKDIVDTAVAAGDFDTLVAAVEAAGLANTLKGPGPFTVFAPTEKAFSRLPKGTLQSLLKPENKEQLKAILTYHVVPGRVSAREAYGFNNAATVNGQRLDITRRDGKLVIGKAKVLATDVNCSNGVIHVINQVLLPDETRIPAVAEKAGQFGTLLTAVSAAGLAEVLDGDGPFTVFAPTDDAFQSLPKGAVETLLKPENRQKLIDILKYHVVSGRVYADQVAEAGQATTLLGSSVETSVSADGLRINDSLVVKGDLETANGVIHVIDSVLLPQPMTPRQAMRTLEDAIRRGVPVFNEGDHSACAEIYTAACQAIVESGSDQIPQSVMTALRTALGGTIDEHDARSRAWTLRHGMDSALVRLREVPPANSSMSGDKERLLFTFESSGAAARWQTTNDGVMGGRSDGRFKINEDKNMEFFGTLSLENNGGFASVRSRGSNLGLEKGDSIVARVRGDGRVYSLNLYTPTRRTAFSYQAKFRTSKDEWIEVRIPLDRFVATSFGRVVRNQQLDPSDVNGLGILLGDKKAGPFELEIDWIKADKTS